MSRAMILSILLLCGTFATTFGESPIEYNRDIRPILNENCFRCHGADSASRKADLRLDKRDVALESKAIVPGDVAKSGLIERILSDDPEQIMPPPASHKKLKPAEKELLKKWIASGAEYQPHWSFIAPKQPETPQVKNAAWVKNPIDNFILAKLEATGLTPAAEADRRTLARRLSLDIRGLPPDPAEVEAFVKEASANAYENLIDQFMKSPKWGEHRARYWLDAARYGDTHGIHFDNYREMWTYRDWVIDSFNKNQRFDQFTIEQLAGDLLPEPTLDQKIATGFNRCNITTNEGGAIAEEYLVLYNRDRTETVAQVWLGLTAGCSVCHNHKFDPLTQREFYSLAAFFNNTTQGAMDGNIKDTPPIIPVVKPEDRARMEALTQEIAAAKQQVEARKQAARAEHDTWAATANASTFASSVPQDALYLHAALSEGQGKAAKLQLAGQEREVPLTDKASWQEGPNGDKALQSNGTALELPEAGDFEKDQAFSFSGWIKIPANDGSGAIISRMDTPENKYRGWDVWVQARRVGMHIISGWSEDALKVVSNAQLPGNQWTHIAVTYDGSAKSAGVKVYFNGQPQPTNVENDNLKSSIKTNVSFKLGQRTGGSPLAGLNIQEMRIYQKTLQPGEVESLAKSTRFTAILVKPVDQRSSAEKNDLYSWWLQTQDKPYQAATSQVTKLEAEQAAIKSRGTIAHVFTEKKEPAMAYVLNRGEYDQRRDQVKPATPEFLPPMPEELPRNRLGLAQWLLRPDNPLAARVTVNRMWQEIFGNGIVKTSGDFGTTGELPSHPELLDWLAVDFRENGWDVQRFYKQIFLSNAYRQNAVVTPEKLAKDPANRLLSRGPRFRMDGEMIRDYALAASGILVDKIGGPSVKPYQPEGVWEAVAMIGSNTRDYKRDTGENLYRRSLYTFWKRSAPPASLEIFNAPNRETCAVRRDRTNTPLQALVTLNDPQHIEAARFLAQRTLKDGGATDTARIDFIAQRLLSRSLRSEELAIVTNSLAELTKLYQADVEEAKKVITVGESKPAAEINPATLAAWTMLINELMNLDEVLNK